MRSDLSLRQERVLRAPPSVVYQMQIAPELLAQWWGPNGFSVPSIDLDVRVGGHLRITMQPPEGEPFFLTGEFREIEPDARLAYTFRWEPPDPDDRETVVVLSLRDLGDSTRLTVEQGSFATEQRLALHEQGWSESLDHLEDLIARRAASGRG
jgi:uncharacterized protein YndB with AHSA1/START domain